MPAASGKGSSSCAGSACRLAAKPSEGRHLLIQVHVAAGRRRQKRCILSSRAAWWSPQSPNASTRRMGMRWPGGAGSSRAAAMQEAAGRGCNSAAPAGRHVPAPAGGIRHDARPQRRPLLRLALVKGNGSVQGCRSMAVHSNRLRPTTTRARPCRWDSSGASGGRRRSQGQRAAPAAPWLRTKPRRAGMGVCAVAAAMQWGCANVAVQCGCAARCAYPS